MGTLSGRQSDDPAGRRRQPACSSDLRHGRDRRGQRNRVRRIADVAYADDSASQVMDIYLPDQPTGNDPVIVLVHGGGFKFVDQEMQLIQPVIRAAAADGYVVASVDYRKSGEAVFPAAVADVKAAVRFLRANADTYGIDPDRVAVWGESAGAYLGLMTALTPEVEALNGDVDENLDQSSAVAALVDFYGPVEFYTMKTEYESWGDTSDENLASVLAFLDARLK